MSTISEREEQARKRVCPRCHAEAGEACKSQGGSNLSGRYAARSPRKHIKSVHPERLALLPFELTWHRAGNGTQRAVDNRKTPHVVYEVGRNDDRTDLMPYYLMCWHDGEDGEAQKRKFSSLATAKRLASAHRCADCQRWRMFGDLKDRGRGFFHCRDRESCEAVTAERDRAEREQYEAIEREPWDAIEVRQGRVVGELVFTRKHSESRSDATSVKMTPADVDKAIEVLTAWRDAHGQAG